MKLKYISAALLVLSAIFVLCFVVFTAKDCYLYPIRYQYGSSPLYLYIVVNAVLFLPPALVCFVVSRFMSRKTGK